MRLALESGQLVTYGGGNVPLAAVSAVLGHTNSYTTSRRYNVSEVPALIVFPLKLEHENDPTGR